MGFIELWYILTVVFWGVYAVKQQKENYPNSKLIKLILVFIVNVIFAPVCMGIALYRGV